MMRQHSCTFQRNDVILPFCCENGKIVTLYRLFLISAYVDLLANYTCILLSISVLYERKRSGILRQSTTTMHSVGLTAP